jgi:hypothetical protein
MSDVLNDHQRQWVYKVRKYMRMEKTLSAIEKAKGCRKMLLYILRDGEMIFKLPDQGKNFAGVLYNSCTRWMQESYRTCDASKHSQYYQLFRTTMKRYRKVYRRHILNTYQNACSCMLRNKIPWEVVGDILSYL